MADPLTQDRSVGINTLNLPDKDWVEILAELDRQAGHYRGQERRQDERFPYRVPGGLIVQIGHPGGSRASYLIRPRNISRQGMGFMHGRFLYPGSSCLFNLKTVDGESEYLPAVVMWCKYIQSGVHEVGVRFEHAINVENFLANFVPSNSDQEGTTALPHLAGKVLHVDDSVDDRELLRFMISKLGPQIHSVETSAEGMALLERMSFDLVLCDYWLKDTVGSDVVRSLRHTGFSGPIIALTADERDEVRNDVMSAGCNDLLVKPYTLETLAELLRSHLPENLSRPTDQVLLSTYWNNQKMRPLIVSFLARMEAHLALIHKRLNAPADKDSLLKLCLELKGAAGGFGFPTIGQAASDLRLLVLEPANPDQIKQQYQKLARLCAAACQVRK